MENEYVFVFDFVVLLGADIDVANSVCVPAKVLNVTSGENARRTLAPVGAGRRFAGCQRRKVVAWMNDELRDDVCVFRLLNSIKLKQSNRRHLTFEIEIGRTSCACITIVFCVYSMFMSSRACRTIFIWRAFQLIPPPLLISVQAYICVCVCWKQIPSFDVFPIHFWKFPRIITKSYCLTLLHPVFFHLSLNLSWLVFVYLLISHGITVVM